MLLKDRLYPEGKRNEYYTPAYAVIPILEFIPKDAIIWCPFDTEESEFVKIIGKQNPVEYSHISSGQDFYTYEPAKWDIIISNPPFTKKRLIFERTLSFNKPFALIMTNLWLNDSGPSKLFKDKELQLLMFNRRMHFYDAEKKMMSNTPFNSSYYCYNFLPKQIIFRELVIR